MRNLKMNPITDAEIIDVLERIADELDQSQLHGDIRPLLLREAAERVREHPKESTDAV